jgi:hypothetical protein
MKKSNDLQLLLLLLLLPPKAWAFTTTPVTPRRASSFDVLSVSKSSSSSSSELWKVEKVDHISDWTTKNHKTYPNPLSLKDKIPSSWFVGLNDAVTAKVQIDALETIDETCVLSDDFLDDDTNAEEEECITDRGMNAEAFVLAGPRSEISFDPSTSKACIVTCGGLWLVVKYISLCFVGSTHPLTYHTPFSRSTVLD